MLVLASRSPRRAELLRQLGVDFDICDVDVEESWDGTEAPRDYVERLALAKSAAGKRLRAADTVLGADTAVVVDDRIFGKPRDRDDAMTMLCRLSGRCHQVYSGVSLFHRAPAVRVSVTRVWFADISEREADAYWQSGEPRDKAGAYAIQGRAARFIERIDGSYSGVVGLPLFETCQLLAEAGSL